MSKPKIKITIKIYKIEENKFLTQQEQLDRPRLYESGIYLKLADQGLIEPIEVWKNVDTTIKGISTKADFEIIDPKEGSSSFPVLVGRPWGRKMKASISLDKERIKLKGDG